MPGTNTELCRGTAQTDSHRSMADWDNSSCGVPHSSHGDLRRPGHAAVTRSPVRECFGGLGEIILLFPPQGYLCSTRQTLAVSTQGRRQVVSSGQMCQSVTRVTDSQRATHTVPGSSALQGKEFSVLQDEAGGGRDCTHRGCGSCWHCGLNSASWLKEQHSHTPGCQEGL